MRVPTYKQETGRTSKGQGRLLTAQLNPRAMAAPMLAVQEAGNALMAYGVEKYKIQVDTQINQATNYLLSELQTISDEAIFSVGDPIVAEDKAKKKMEQLVIDVNNGAKFPGTEPLLTNKTAKNQFTATSFKLLSEQLRQLQKDNFQNVKNQKIANMDTVIERSQDIISNLSRPFAERQSAMEDIFNPAYGAIASGVRDNLIDSKGSSTRIDEAYDNIVRTIADRLMSSAPDPQDVAQAIEDGTVPDAFFNMAFQELPPKTKQAVIKDMFTIAKARNDRADEEAEKIEQAQEDIYKSDFAFIINQGDVNPTEAKIRYEKLKGAHWFDSKTLKEAKAVLNIDQPVARKESDPEAVRTIETAIITNNYSMDVYEAVKTDLNAGDRGKYLGELDNERKEGYGVARNKIARAMGYIEGVANNDELGYASGTLYNTAMSRLQEKIDERDKAGTMTSYMQMQTLAETVITDMQEETKTMITQALISQLSNMTELTKRIFGDGFVVDPNRPIGSALDAIAEQNRIAPNAIRFGRAAELEELRRKFGIE